jgi:hypothetical protein
MLRSWLIPNKNVHICSTTEWKEPAGGLIFKLIKRSLSNEVDNFISVINIPNISSCFRTWWTLLTNLLMKLNLPPRIRVLV